MTLDELLPTIDDLDPVDLAKKLSDPMHAGLKTALAGLHAVELANGRVAHDAFIVTFKKMCQTR